MGSGSIRRSAGALFRGVLSGSREKAGTFTDVPTTFCASTASSDPTAPNASATTGSAERAARHGFPLRTVAALASAGLLATPLLAGTAHADPKEPKEPKAPKPPAKMSQIGGDRLGTPGVQVALKPGAPKLPGPDTLTARSWIVSDAESGKVLAAKNPHWRLAPASTLKMLFADTVLPKFPKDQKHTVKPADLAGMGDGSSLVGIKENLSYSVRDLWLGVFLRSGNDAVHTLSAMNGGTKATVAQMQRHAKELNAQDTHVVTPDGYDAPGQVSSAYDLSLFARSGLQNPDFREYCSTASAQFPGEKGKDGKRATFGIQNTNRLLSGDYDMKPYPGIAGVKNGSTTNAGSTFTGVAQRGDRKLLVTVMNPAKKEHNEAYKEAAKLLDWGFAAADKVEPVGRLVGPRSEDDGTGTEGAKGKGDGAEQSTQAALDSASGRSGVWTAVGLTAAAMALLVVGAFAVHRRWPLPELVRGRRSGK
ncbi:D-alanyl-D-alanine carboxypeptidase [Streptomyces sp. Je 1-4]|uniref:D-alanyl-D-alanine carboxypeptidase family protein n=1 Tax=Streptomyces TaxID=1883 RepID=UPI0021D97383|nr:MULTISPECIES: D-alanyl-D-alanine carboxypeptidase [unclassified Streptomyces]UYB40361.1 D-alanyl-D-alanine carboxypeptidase [Streptomyces sp. Je 1-4]UZQ36474.1 D-alanyl-D-alanine carboxypeptidase [Streptomyces sp. Je 1-4] [Streptomyces sp. Je 1-4 4N24]UZQ43891.1 D-alanyl-D-alanine carboxypeptidase [Streptomyces sp. Je 1-4] [Streptomyces sp. Je 1-4 4N24_ara]